MKLDTWQVSYGTIRNWSYGIKEIYGIAAIFSYFVCKSKYIKHTYRHRNVETHQNWGVVNGQELISSMYSASIYRPRSSPAISLSVCFRTYLVHMYVNVVESMRSPRRECRLSKLSCLHSEVSTRKLNTILISNKYINRRGSFYQRFITAGVLKHKSSQGT